jgi:hypothetical protein
MLVEGALRDSYIEIKKGSIKDEEVDSRVVALEAVLKTFEQQVKASDYQFDNATYTELINRIDVIILDKVIDEAKNLITYPKENFWKRLRYLFTSKRQ